MNDETPTTAEHTAMNESDATNWIALALVSSSYFVMLMGVMTYCLVLP